jgi:hypothetical protein
MALTVLQLAAHIVNIAAALGQRCQAHHQAGVAAVIIHGHVTWLGVKRGFLREKRAAGVEENILLVGAAHQGAAQLDGAEAAGHKVLGIAARHAADCGIHSCGRSSRAGGAT